MRNLILMLACVICSQSVVLGGQMHPAEQRYQHRERRIQEAEERGDITPQEAAVIRERQRKEQAKGGESAEADKSAARDNSKPAHTRYDAPADP